jgi:hypothetical protein
MTIFNEQLDRSGFADAANQGDQIFRPMGGIFLWAIIFITEVAQNFGLHIFPQAKIT